MDPWLLVTGWSRRLPRDAVFTGRTAAWLFGIDVDPTPIEVVVPPNSGLRSRPGLEVHRCDVADVMTVRGLRVTTIERTLVDACRRLSEVEGLVLWDAAVRLRLTERAGLAEPAESPMETRLRWLLIQAGLPRPEVQTNLHDASGRFIGRADLYYPVARLVIEFDGSNHRDRLVEDNRRQNALLNAGFKLLRFTAADLSQRPEGIVAQVRSAL
jgi:very-short-patch-repair endonuclease